MLVNSLTPLNPKKPKNVTTQKHVIQHMPCNTMINRFLLRKINRRAILEVCFYGNFKYAFMATFLRGSAIL